jgi:hypothetical protein
MLQNTLQVNKQVEDSNIHELFTFYNQAFFNGKLDDIRIYNRALTQEEITYLANN